MGQVNTKGNCWGMGAGTYENSVLPAQFFCNPKTALKNIIYYIYLNLRGPTLLYLRDRVIMEFPLQQQ